MSFHADLLLQTATAHHRLVGIPIIQGCLRGDVSLPSYVAFLSEAYHRARHAVPLLRACQAALPERHAGLAAALPGFIDEQQGQAARILDDLRSCCVDSEVVRQGRPPAATEVMVAYAYDTITRGNPLGFFGMLHVLRSTRAALARPVVERIQGHLHLPDSACGHLLRAGGPPGAQRRFAQLMDGITEARDQADVVHAAKMFYRLYGDVLRSLPLPEKDSACCLVA